MSKRSDATQDSDAQQRRAPASLWNRIGQAVIDMALWTVGIIGLISLLAAIAAYIWGYSIILFSTGSMSPTIPAGSAALVQRIPASEVRVGDVVTVDRHDALPITHRVTSISAATGPSKTYIITMKGDANHFADVSPYQVSEVRRVVASVPGVARPIDRLHEPWLLAALTGVAAALVTWAFWPRRRREPARLIESDTQDQSHPAPEPSVAAEDSVSVSELISSGSTDSA